VRLRGTAGFSIFPSLQAAFDAACCFLSKPIPEKRAFLDV